MSTPRANHTLQPAPLPRGHILNGVQRWAACSLSERELGAQLRPQHTFNPPPPTRNAPPHPPPDAPIGPGAAPPVSAQQRSARRVPRSLGGTVRPHCGRTTGWHRAFPRTPVKPAGHAAGTAPRSAPSPSELPGKVGTTESRRFGRGLTRLPTPRCVWLPAAAACPDRQLGKGSLCRKSCVVSPRPPER